ncbi:hypothetical protein BJ875DRAFT_5162 [Amylocarpus encephaloides]|uniref:FAD-binding domain-containing protein n=1 Tax=Amylocarpus encephaloides TaxID=45428 RepID=A0A9P7YJ58_9HELO|nr:hypothetical protein BJ875DRAFT_5162 [Amylocarpus encephaloides]
MARQQALSLPKIAIVGAGPSGLVLASHLLRTHPSFPLTVFDLRSLPSPDAVSQPSGSLDLHPESGLLAIKSCGLLSKFESLAGECSEDMILANKDGEIKHQDHGDGSRPEISRNALTDLLLSSVPGGVVTWETKVLSVMPSTSNGWMLQYQNKGCSTTVQEEFDLIVGADGAWSRVSPSITKVVPFYSTVNCITLTIPHLTTSYPHLASVVGTGTYSALGHGKGCFSQRGSMGSTRVYLMLASESETYLSDSGLTALATKPEELKQRMVGDGEFYRDWSEDCRALIRAGCDAEARGFSEGDCISIKPLSMLPKDHTWTHVPGLTLIGDAAHLMTPFAGEGVNLAMIDALRLSEAISSAIPPPPSDFSPERLDAAIETFEKEMWERAHPVQEQTLMFLGLMFQDPDAPAGFVRKFEEMFAAMAAGQGGPPGIEDEVEERRE